MKVGDILVSTWGWGQTNVDFFKVVEISSTGKTAWLRKIGKYYVDKNGNHIKQIYGDGEGLAIPNSKRYIDTDILKKRVLIGTDSEEYCHMNSARSMISARIASPWDGSPIRESWYY